MSPHTAREVFARSARIVGRRIAGEYVLVPLVTHGADLDAIYNLNVVGAFIWERLDGRRTGMEIVSEMTDTFDVEPEQAQTDYLDFVARLRELGAVETVEG